MGLMDKQQAAWRNRIVGYSTKPADQFLAHSRNWRKHPQSQRDALSASLSGVGWVGAVIENVRTGHVLDGHERIWQALERNEDVPYLQVDVSEDEELLILATFDPITQMAVTDATMLEQLLADLQSSDLVMEDAGLEALLASVAVEAGAAYATGDVADDPGAQIDRAEELREQWQTERGQVWEIPSASLPGRSHRLMCGDSTSAEDVGRLMAGEKAVLLASDPPYNVNVDYGEEIDDLKSETDYEVFSRAWFGLWKSVSDRQIVTPGCNNLARWTRYFEPYHIAPWTKTNSMTNGKVARWWCWEPVFFFGEQWKRMRANDVFDYPIGAQSGVANHPCPKPLRMWIDLLENYSDHSALTADAFGGSGTSFVAAEQTGRICYGMELEPKYVAVTLERLAGMGLAPMLTDPSALET